MKGKPSVAGAEGSVFRGAVATQQSMSSRLGPFDDLSIHRHAETLAVAGGGEPEWFEHDTTVTTPPGGTGSPYVLNWFQFHPNKGRAQAWIMLNDGATQYNVVLKQDRLPSDLRVLEVGALRFEIIEPMLLYRTVLEPSEGIPFYYDFTLRARHQPKLFDKRTYWDEDSSFQVEHCHTDQGLICSDGSLTYGENTYDMAGFQAYRDHCWGRRAGPHRGRAFHVPLLAHFSDRTLSMWYEELTDGSPLYAVGHIALDDGTSLSLESFQHSCEVEGASGDVLQMEWLLGDDSGKRHTLSVKPLYRGGYQRYSEVLGERLHHSGAAPVEEDGQADVDVKALPLMDPAVRLGPWAREQRQQYCEFVLDGEVGYGTCIYYVSPRHAKYGEQLESS